MSGRDTLFRNGKIVPYLLHIMLDTYVPTTPNQTLALNGAQAGQGSLLAASGQEWHVV